MSVSTGTPKRSRKSTRIGSACSSPMPRTPFSEVRLALSNEVLKIRPMPAARATPAGALDLDQGSRTLHDMAAGLELTGAGDQHQRQVIAEGQRPDRDMHHFPPPALREREGPAEREGEGEAARPEATPLTPT